MVAGILFAQKDPPDELSGTLEKLLRQVQDLQAQTRMLQESLRQLSRAARSRPKQTPLVVTSPGAPEPPPPPDPAAVNLEKALSAYRRGIELENGKMCGQAIEEFGTAIKLDPKNDSALLHRGYCFARLNNFADAAADLTKSLSIQPNNSRAYLARATAYATLGQNSLAMLDVNEALDRDPNSPDGRLLRGRLYQTDGDNDKAAMDYTVALSLAPDTETAFLGRAESLRKQGLQPLALADCDNAVRVNPSSPAGYLCRAETFTKTGASDRAIEQLNQAMLAAQTLHQPLNILAELMNKMSGNPIVAAVPIVPPPNAQPLPPQIVAQAKPPAPAPAVAEIHPGPSSSLKPSGQKLRDKHDAGLYERLGRVRASESRFADAIKAYDQAVQLDPAMAPAFNGRGYARLRLNDVDHAIGDFSEAVRLNPSYVNAYQNRSVARRLKGDREGAMQDDQKVREIFRAAGLLNTSSAVFVKTSDSRPAH